MHTYGNWELDAEQARLAEAHQDMLDAIEEDPESKLRYARILATVATSPTEWWPASEIAMELGDVDGAAQTAEDCRILGAAWLLDVKESNDGGGEGPEYSLPADDAWDFMLLGAERWLAKMLEEKP